MVDTVKLYIFISLIDIDFHWRSQGCKKAKLLYQWSHKVSYQLGWNLVYCWDVLQWWTSCSFFSCPFSIQGREVYLCDFVKNVNIGLHSNISRTISFKLSMMIRTTRLYILMSVWITLIFIQITSVSIFSEISWSIWMKFCKLPQPVVLLKLVLNLLCRSNVQGRELCRHDFRKGTVNIVLCQYSCELICFKLGMMIDSTKLYNLIPVWMTLMFTKVTGKLELV